MSFILDALRKSESERRRDTVPDITRIPLAPTRLGLPSWVVPVTTVLGLAVIGLSAAWWYNARSVPAEPPARNELAARGTAPGATDGLTQSAAAPRGRAASTNAAARAGESEPSESRTREVVPLGEVAAGPARATPDEPATREPAPSRADEADTAAETGAETEIAASLPRLAELRAEGVALPELKLELHVFSETPANRFVFIDGSRYGEGDTLDSGQEVVRVTPDGAVLSHSGRRFLLLPD